MKTGDLVEIMWPWQPNNFGIYLGLEGDGYYSRVFIKGEITLINTSQVKRWRWAIK